MTPDIIFIQLLTKYITHLFSSVLIILFNSFTIFRWNSQNPRLTCSLVLKAQVDLKKENNYNEQ